MHIIFLFYLHRKSIGSGFPQSVTCEVSSMESMEQQASKKTGKTSHLANACFLLTTAAGGGVRTDGGLVNVGYLRLKKCWKCGGKTKESTCFHSLSMLSVMLSVANSAQTPSQISPWQDSGATPRQFHQGRPRASTAPVWWQKARWFEIRGSNLSREVLDILKIPERWMGSNIKLNGN